MKDIKILEAALFCFGQNGFKKTAVEEIAKYAQVSKGLVFHYFKDKKRLYQATYDYALAKVKEYFDVSEYHKERDFFKRMKMYQVKKLKVYKEESALITFFMNECRVEDSQKIMMEDYMIYFEGIDMNRFKDGINIKQVINIVMWCALGVIKQNPSCPYVQLFEEMDEYLMILQKSFYKEEYCE